MEIGPESQECCRDTSEWTRPTVQSVDHCWTGLPAVETRFTRITLKLPPENVFRQRIDSTVKIIFSTAKDEIVNAAIAGKSEHVFP
ncbi:hypothetical protein E2562_024521 [Oryza meyeriana var. granulata]|uniref:Uncharacterized protein n=1 Tax=Oryza meyeriana var. granulata TaxID=110450 RepID=A0A6G1BNA5_9ORYZ|nr:hypothetical protein E2562_024521 [Oryza meyeriana var. granulata]